MVKTFYPIKRTLPLSGISSGCHRIAVQKTHQKGNQGFTLVEVLLAGLITVMTLTAVARFSVSAIAGSHNKAVRSNIEAEIFDNMERIQQKDSQLTWKAIKDSKEEIAACSNPSGLATYLSSKLNEESSPYFVARPRTFGNEINLKRTIITEQGTSNRMTALIIYRFNMPDKKLNEEQRIMMNQYTNGSDESKLYPNEEQRVLELNPNYAPHCFQL